MRNHLFLESTRLHRGPSPGVRAADPHLLQSQQRGAGPPPAQLLVQLGPLRRNLLRGWALGLGNLGGFLPQNTGLLLRLGAWGGHHGVEDEARGVGSGHVGIRPGLSRADQRSLDVVPLVVRIIRLGQVPSAGLAG